jgi:transcriptional regulator with XRE-family HTH domain
MGKIKLNRIKEVMAEVGVNSVFVANAIGKDASTFSGYYNNNRQPSLLVLFQIAVACRVSPSELISKEMPEGVSIKKPLLKKSKNNTDD